MNVGRVGRLWRYPVKSMRGEECREIEVGARGFEGDRVFALQDAAGKLGSGKDTRRFRNLDGLLAFCARYGGDAPDIVFPDGRQIRGDDPRAHRALSEALGIPVTLARETRVPHFDDGAVHLVSTGALAWLRSRLPGSRIDERRFRPNIVVEAPGLAQAEQAWIGKTLRIGAEVELRVSAPTERCRMTTLGQDDLPADPEVLRCIAQEAGLQFGVYAEVVKPGRIAAGDAVVLD
jgi:hypothetical protein